MRLDRLREHRNALVAFHNAYVAYLEASDPAAPASQHERLRLRSEVAGLLADAQTALGEAEVNITITPPPLFGGPILHGLANTVFAHEARGSTYGDVPQMVIETLRVADGYLAQRERAIERRRRSFTYWGDRILRSVLGFPAYLLSLILGVPFDRIDQSPWGTALRLAELVLAVLGTYFGGKAIGWW